MPATVTRPPEADEGQRLPNLRRRAVDLHRRHARDRSVEHHDRDIGGIIFTNFAVVIGMGNHLRCVVGLAIHFECTVVTAHEFDAVPCCQHMGRTDQRAGAAVVDNTHGREFIRLLAVDDPRVNPGIHVVVDRIRGRQHHANFQ